jgi:S-adenosylmethionine:tRNA ribosyltransferase-isomerase
MRVDEFDYVLPPTQIAQKPPPRRGDSRLLVLGRTSGVRTHSHFSRVPQWLRRGDVLVRNDTQVIPARLRGQREGGGALEILLARRERIGDDGEVWLCLARPGRRLRAGSRARFPGGIEGMWLDDGGEDVLRRIRLVAEQPILEVLSQVGEVPLPPYIDRLPTAADRVAYQTVYARVPGAVAAPTAGLHFTEDLLGEIRASGVEIHNLTLHVGPATFLPVRTEEVEAHRMAQEEVDIPPDTCEGVRRAKAEGRRIVAVGTTTVRALEGAFGAVGEGRRAVSIFIAPGYHFRVVDALITNFHLPRSTLLMLVAAFAGRERVLRAYQEAIEHGYRFYSYGDAMLIA